MAKGPSRNRQDQDRRVHRAPSDLRTNAVGVVIDALPFPDTKSSWAELFDFLEDREVRSSLLALRVWMNRAAISGASAAVLADELAALVADYSLKVARHGLVTMSQTVEVVVSGSADFDRLAVFRGYSVNPKHAFLTDAETRNIGSEVAFIVRTREAFGR